MANVREVQAPLRARYKADPSTAVVIDRARVAVAGCLRYHSRGKFAESEPVAREAVEMDRKKRPDNWQRFRAESLLGASLAGQKKYAEAEPLLL
jgi:hypothetical protein